MRRYLSVVKETLVENGGEEKLNGRHELVVYVTSECMSCKAALEIAKVMASRFPALRTTVVKLDDPGAHKPEYVFAVPTYVLDRRIVSLGNPHPEQLQSLITRALCGKGMQAPPGD